MDDALLVRRFERGCDLARNRQRLREGYWTPRDALRQRLACDELENERLRVAEALHRMQRRDARVIERGEHTRLALETREALRIEPEAIRQNLDRDVAAVFDTCELVDAIR
jgi:hypothetical protein